MPSVEWINYDVCTRLSNRVLPRSAGIAVGFYGNGESSDGASRVAYSLRHANRTISGVEKLVRAEMLFPFFKKNKTKHFLK